MTKTTKKATKNSTQLQAGAITSETTTAPTPAPVAAETPTRKLVVEDYADRPKAPPVASTEPVTPPVSPAPTKPEVVKPSKSTVEKPTKAVWAIADEMRKANPQATRKEIVDECIRRGIAFYTARTQYQRWSKSHATPT